ncbi:acyl-CoA thioesterase [Achromobacter sp. GG226]|uniref:acyl-CoA thioesterase n=1 Tax=Verticiella alkaliphila TaxID=2779529 RepID=UPI001C0C258A|nr:thioesterase family protein [Verticiella sp. GG226]MBU4612557.1 acyl-CoA thioesterase [Verticiella sp. GG226]
MNRSEFAFFHPLRVRWAEVDMQKVVFNGHYMLYFDVAFTEYWRATGLPNSQVQAREGIEMFLRRATIDYQASAEFDDELEIGMRCARLGRSSMTVQGGIFRGDTFLVGGELLYVYADVAAKKGVPIPTAWREHLATFERVAPETA